MPEFAWLIPLGFAVGVCGTLIGAGGGFILMPVLLLMYPAAGPDVLTAVSLAVVFCNAVSGSISYARMKRIDYRSGLLFAAAAAPTAFVGAYATEFISRRLFNGIFGTLLVAVAAFLFLQARVVVKAERAGSLDEPHPVPHKHGRRYYLTLGTILSFFVGFISNLLGIGGGIIHVPMMVTLLNFPVHVATATSHFILVFVTLVGFSQHLAKSNYAGFEWITLWLAVGVVVGAQLGARLSKRVGGRWIIRSLSVALILVGVRILLKAM